MFDKFYVGGDVMSSAENGVFKPVSRITLLLDDSKAVTAGDDTGREIVANCPYATQEMVDALLASIKGYEYQAYEAGEANIDPAAELGDGVTVGGVYSVIAHIRDNGSGFASLSAPGEAELEDEFPMDGPITQMVNREIKKVGSFITKTAEEILMEVHGVEENLTYLELDLDAITGRVKNIEGDIGTLELTADSLTGRIEDAEGNIGTLELTAEELRSEISGKIDGDYAKTLINQALGEITLSASSSLGSTTFKLAAGGTALDTETLDISVKAAKISGKLTVDQLNITGSITFGDLDEDTQEVISDAYSLAYYNQLPSYIKNTYISSTEIRSPAIVGGEFYGNEFNVVSEESTGAFNMYGKVAGSNSHVLSISHYGEYDPSIVFSSPVNANATWRFSHTSVQGTLSLGTNDIDFYVNGKIVTLRDLEARIAALEV